MYHLRYEVHPVLQHPYVPATEIPSSFINYASKCRSWKGNWSAHQHAPAAEAHHAESALEHEALVVSGSDPRLEGLGAADPIRLLGLPLGVVHPLHVLSQFVLPLGKSNQAGKHQHCYCLTTCYKSHNASCSDISLGLTSYHGAEPTAWMQSSLSGYTHTV